MGLPLYLQVLLAHHAVFNHSLPEPISALLQSLQQRCVYVCAHACVCKCVHWYVPVFFLRI